MRADTLRSMLRTLVLTSLLSAPAFTPPAPAPAEVVAADADQPPKSARAAADLRDLIEPICAHAKLPAMGVAVVTVDGVIGLGVTGVRERGGSTPVTVNDRWHLGSCTKAITATLCGALVHKHLLRWDSTVGDVLGNAIPMLDPAWSTVTLEELLRHRGGAPGTVTPEIWSAAWRCKQSPQVCRSEFIAAIVAQPPAQPRGTFVYSNQGYAIAGCMCEAAANAAWEDLVRTHVCAPLGITSAGFGAPSTATGGASPKGHDATGGVSDGDNPAAIGPAGTMHMTLADWSRFVQAHLGEPAPNAGLALPPSIIKHLHSADDGAQSRAALGWMVADRAWGGRVLTHAGSNTLWYCVAWVAPEKQFAVLVTCNQGGDGAAKACDTAAGAAIEWFRKARSTPAGK